MTARAYGEVSTIDHMIPFATQEDFMALRDIPGECRRIAEWWLMVGMGAKPERSRVDYRGLRVIETLAAKPGR